MIFMWNRIVCNLAFCQTFQDQNFECKDEGMVRIISIRFLRQRQKNSKQWVVTFGTSQLD